MAACTPEIVVVDDSPTSISLYELSTAPLAVRLRAFRSPVDSLLYLRDNQVALIFLDIIMREMDGLTLLKKLRELEHHRETPVVIVTSKDYAQDRSTARRLGAVEYLVKPVRSQEIRETMCRHVPGLCAPTAQAASRR